MKSLNFSSKPIKIAISFALIILYLWLFKWIGLFFFIISGVTFFLFMGEKTKIESGHERFRKDNLFFRYGIELDSAVLSIKVKENWTEEERTGFADSIVNKIMDGFNNELGLNPLKGKQIVTVIGVTDNDRPNQPRGFLKISFTGPLGAIISRFMTYSFVGKNLVFIKMVYLLGLAQWFDILFFTITSPFTILFWVFRWFRGEYSIYAATARGIDNSFETLDLRSYYKATDTLITDKIEDVLRANNLLNEELQQIINIFGGNTNVGGVQIVGNNNIVSNIK